MEGFLKVLFQYALESQVTGYLETREFRRAVGDLEEDWEAFQSGLTAEQGQALNTLLEQERKVGYLTEEAAFASGISIGVNLGRL